MKNDNAIIFIFLDGVGIGKIDHEFNPFFKYGFKTFTSLFGEIPSLEKSTLVNGNKFLFPTDANLGIDGLPQSGTGQTSIFCGVNAPQIINQHFGPFPYSTLVPIIEEKNIFKYFLDKGEKVSFVNAYPQQFFDYINSGKKRLSVTTMSCTLNKMKLNGYDDLINEEAITAEIINKIWREKLGYELPIITPQKAGEIFLKITKQNKFTAYEFFLTDHFGHGRLAGREKEIMQNLDEFLFYVLTNFDDKKETIIICSDHGNCEDLSISTHTRNPSLMIAAGYKAEEIFKSVKDISQIKDAITGILS